MPDQLLPGVSQKNAENFQALRDKILSEIGYKILGYYQQMTDCKENMRDIRIRLKNELLKKEARNTKLQTGTVQNAKG